MEPMSPWIGNLLFVMGVIASILIRIPHDKVSQKTQVAKSRKDTREKILLGLVMMGMILLPVLSFTPLLAFASYPPQPVALVVGVLMMILSLWLFHRSHADLGRNWSPTLEIRREHQLLTHGVYRSIRHPVYTSIFLLALAQLLLLSNWIAGPALLVAFTAMFASRMTTEEQLMLDQFGEAYVSYRQQTKRLIPGVW